MNTNHVLFASLLLLASAVDVHAQSFDIDLTKTQPTYSVENGSGYDIVAAPDAKVKVAKTKGAVSKAKNDASFFYSVKVADGNYKVTVVLGSKKKAAHISLKR